MAVLHLSAAAESDVLEWGDSDFKSGVAQHETVLVMFYAPWYVIMFLSCFNMYSYIYVVLGAVIAKD